VTAAVEANGSVATVMTAARTGARSAGVGETGATRCFRRPASASSARAGSVRKNETTHGT
jgi:hypothetical protein